MSHVVKTLEEVGQHFGKCRRTVQRWVRAGMPRLASRRYDLEQIGEWVKTARYLGSSFRQLEADARVDTLFQTAVVHLRVGLQNLCTAYLKARGTHRALLIDRAVRQILNGTLQQMTLLGGGEDDE
jgi:hypothetical protein